MIKFEKVQTKDQFEKWQTFAATFDHSSDSPHLPLVMVSDESGEFGYWSTLNFPVVMPAFSPEKTTPRKFKEMVDAISNAHTIATLGAPQHSGGACYIALEETPAVDKDIIRKLGFEELNLKLWRKA